MTCWEDANTLRDVDADRALARKIADDERRLIEQVRAELREDSYAVRVRRVREEKRLTRKEFAPVLGVTKWAVRNFEQGRTEPKRAALERLVQIEMELGVRV